MASVNRKHCLSMHRGYRKFAHNLFCAWDYRIATECLASNRHYMIWRSFREMLDNKNEATQVRANFWAALCFWGVEIIKHLAVALMLLLPCYMLKLFCLYIESWQDTYWKYYCLGLLMHGIILIAQYLFTCFAAHHATQQMVLVRSYLAQSFLLAALIVHYAEQKLKFGSWEQQAGLLVWALSCADLTFIIFIAPILFMLWHTIHVRLKVCAWNLLEFQLSLLNINTLYGQTLLWLGLFYAPLLPALSLLKLLLTFYVHKLVLFRYGRVPKTSSVTVALEGVQLTLTFVSLSCVLFVQAYFSAHAKLSKHCGPFDNYSYMHEVLLHGILRINKGSMLGRLLLVIVRPAGVFVMLVLLSIKAYYMYVKSKSQRKMASVLREMLKWEFRDRRFLLKQLQLVQCPADSVSISD